MRHTHIDNAGYRRDGCSSLQGDTNFVSEKSEDSKTKTCWKRGKSYIRAQTANWLWLLHVTQVTILSDQSVLCSVLTTPVTNSSACLEPQTRWYQKKNQVPGTIHNGKPNKCEWVELSRTTRWNYKESLWYGFDLNFDLQNANWEVSFLSKVSEKAPKNPGFFFLFLLSVLSLMQLKQVETLEKRVTQAYTSTPKIKRNSFLTGKSLLLISELLGEKLWTGNMTIYQSCSIE